MSKSLDLEPRNLLMLAVLGIGAYWFVTRQARASVLVPRVGQAQTVASSPNVVGGLLSGIGALLGAPKTTSPSYPTAISNSSLPGSESWGWQYFTDGTAISPDGVYYYQGQQVWSPDMNASNPVGGASGGW